MFAPCSMEPRTFGTHVVSLTGSQRILRNNVSATLLERDLEAFSFVIALIDCGVVAAELSLSEPLELESDRSQSFIRPCAIRTATAGWGTRAEREGR